MSMDHGYFIFLTGEGPLKDLPFAWFAYIEDAKSWAVEHSSFGHECEVRPAELEREYAQANGHLLECLTANAACFRVIEQIALNDPGALTLLEQELSEAGVKEGFGKRCGDFLNAHGVKWPPSPVATDPRAPAA